MEEKSLVFGVSYAVDSLIMSLLKKNIDLNLDEVGGYIKKDLDVLKKHTLSDYGGVENDREVFES